MRQLPLQVFLRIFINGNVYFIIMQETVGRGDPGGVQMYPFLYFTVNSGL